MLLKFSSSDMLNTELINVHTNQVMYTIVTRASYIRGKNDEIMDVESRITEVLNTKGNIVTLVEWAGKEKRQIGSINIMDEPPMKLSDLFDGCSSVLSSTDSLCVPSRLDMTWNATRESITLTNLDTDKIEGRLLENAVQVGDRLFRTHLPGLGSNFIEFTDRPEAVLLEFLVGYILMDIMRRARFNLKKYEFSQVRRHSLFDSRMDLFQKRLSSGIVRKLRRGTL